VADEILFARAHADAAFAAAALVPVVGDRGALDVAGVGDRDRHVFLDDQVEGAELAGFWQDLGATRRRRTSRRTWRSSDTMISSSSLSLERIARSRSISFRILGELVEDLLTLQDR
jgi:hypothetical protein